MKKTLATLGSLCLAILSVVLIITMVVLIFSGRVLYRKFGLVLDFAVFSALLYFAGLIFVKFVDGEKRKTISKAIFATMLGVYIFFLFYISIMIYIYGAAARLHVPFAFYSESSINLIPFATIVYYVKEIGTPYFNETIDNLIGNLIAFLPFALFLPILFKKMRKPLFFILTVLLVSIVIEALQLLLKVGSCDIDDVILNVGGAVIFYFIFRIKPIKEFIYKAAALEF